MEQDGRARDYLEQLVPLQEAWDETRDRLTDLKREARSDGLNLDAINALLQILSKYPHDKGAAVLNEMIRYAEAFGTEELVSRTVAPAPRPPANKDTPLEPVTAAEASPQLVGQARPAAASRLRSSTGARLRISTQIVTAIGLTVGLMWLLN